MSDPNHPIFKQFTELDPSLIVIRDTPHPDWVWNQPPVMGTLTPGYAHHASTNPCIHGNGESWAPQNNGSQARARPQRWQPEFPGLWDDIPGSGTTSLSSNMPHLRPYPLPQSNELIAMNMGHSGGLAGSGGSLPERQNRPRNGSEDRRTTRPEHHRL